MSEVLEAGESLWGRLSQASSPFEEDYRRLRGELAELWERESATTDSEERESLREEGRRISGELASIRGERDAARAAAITEGLSAYRSLGLYQQRWEEGSPERISRAVDEEISELFPSDWLRASREFGPLEGRFYEGVSGQYTPLLARKEEEPEAESGLLELSSEADEDRRRRVLAHEFCHRIEETTPEVVGLEREFYNRRLASGEGFFDPYCRRRYTPEEVGIEAYELLSMGVEHLYMGPREDTEPDTTEDPEFERFILGLLAVGARREEDTNDNE